MIALSDVEQKLVKEILRKHLAGQDYKVVIFGSRATGQAKRYSDIDLSLIGDKKVDRSVLFGLSEDFEESNLPYTVDVVDFMRTDERMQGEIQQNGVELSLT